MKYKRIRIMCVYLHLIKNFMKKEIILLLLILVIFRNLILILLSIFAVKLRLFILSTVIYRIAICTILILEKSFVRNTKVLDISKIEYLHISIT
jgi:hypothetical protein